MLKIFSNNYVKAFTEQSSQSVINHGDKVALIIADGGFALPSRSKYEVLEITDTSITFIVKGYCYIHNGETAEEFKKRIENNSESYDYIVENEVKLIFANDIWKIDNLKRRLF